MIDVSYLYCGKASASVPHRYGEKVSCPECDKDETYPVSRAASLRRPIVVWNITKTCNLRCRHCYTDSGAGSYAGELRTEEALKVIEDLAFFEVPAVLFSGGEPLLRKDLFGLADSARARGIRTILSTNGSLISSEVAEKIRSAGFSYVGVSLDGLAAAHDRFRGVGGAFDQTLSGIRRLIAVGQKTGLRLTMTDSTMDQVDVIFDLIEKEGIRRVCFYHLVPSGRGKEIFCVKPGRIREKVDLIFERTETLLRKGYPVEVLTVDHHADGPYLYLKLKGKGDPRAEEVYRHLAWNGGGANSSGVGIACIDAEGDVHPDQFWSHYSLGSVRERKFGEIWSNPDEPLLEKLRHRRDFIRGRCEACRFFEACGGSLRVRAEIATGDVWASDPACYLTDEEIGL
ncbi:MAG TPA: radical SAM protein [Candidatus Omnitrophota bacterium]|nr:radical SAM protein [Candidatus Omnitrophota bacterium]